MLRFSLGPGILNDCFCSDWEFLAEVPAHSIGKKFVPGPSENGRTGGHGFSRATKAGSKKGFSP